VFFRHVRLRATAHALGELEAFYGNRLGLPGLRIGETQLELALGEGEPFYHFAFLVPGNRFDAALDWIGGLAELLPDPETGDVVFDFQSWDGQACYFHDPAGNIVELTAHRAIGAADATDATGPFSGSELLGFSELGLVGDRATMAGILRFALNMPLWQGTVEDEDRLAFVGEKGRTLILAPVGRGWLPTGRLAERHPVEAVLTGPPSREAVLEDGLYRISRA
jgi:catechol 2,3-dioxygenase-like lactoylglutathione lyase family enzyme